MGSGARHGRRHHAAHRRRVHHNRRRRHRRNHRAHHNNATNFQSHVIFGAVTRRGATAQTTQNSQGANITYYSSSSSSSGQTSPLIAYFPVCRVVSVFLWFAGIMMMSLGGFRTPIGFIGVGCLVVGILLLIFTSFVMSASCAQRFQNNADPEQPAPPNPPEGNNQAFRSVRPLVETSPPGAMPFGDSVPAYPSPDPASDKPPSYEEVMAGQYPSTISASVLPPIPEDVDTQPVSSQSMSASAPTMPPYPVSTPQAASEPIIPPYPVSTPQAASTPTIPPYPGNMPQALPVVNLQPYPPVDSQSYQRTENQRTLHPGTLYPPPATDNQLDNCVALGPSYQVNTPQSSTEAGSSQIVSSFEPLPESISEEVEPVTSLVPSQPQVSTPASTSPLAETSSSDTLPIVQVDTLQTLPLEPSSQNDIILNETSMHLNDSGTSVNNSIENSSHGHPEVITVTSEVVRTGNEEKTDAQPEHVDGLSQSGIASGDTEC